MVKKQAAITSEQIDAILPFLEVYEQRGFKCGEWQEPESDTPGQIVLPYFEFSEPVGNFIDALYKNGWVEEFDWFKWQDKAIQYVESQDKLTSAKAETVRRLLTTHVRKDRFCEGHLASMFENGHISALLRRLKVIRQEMHPVADGPSASPLVPD